MSFGYVSLDSSDEAVIPAAPAQDLTLIARQPAWCTRRFGRALAARDVDHVAIRVGGESGQIAGVVDAELRSKALRGCVIRPHNVTVSLNDFVKRL